MAINTSELGNQETDMTNWDPDPTNEVATPVADAVAPESSGSVGASAPSVEPPVRPRVSALVDPTLQQRPSDIARTATQPAATQPIAVTQQTAITQTTPVQPGAHNPVPLPAQRPQVVPVVSALPRPATAPTSTSGSPTSVMPPPHVPAPSKLPPRQEWLGTQSPANAPTLPTRRAAAPTPTTSFGASSPPPMVAPPAAPAESSPKVGWLWPAIAAFVVGGLLTGLGFRIGTQSIETTAAPAVTTAVSNTLPPVLSPPVVNTDENPAAFVADKLGPSVVTVETDRGLGSGVIFDDGLILTNNHVIEGAGQIQVRLANGGLLEATLVGADPRVDIAVVSVGPGRNLPQADLALGEELEVGELAVAIGSPFQLQQTVTAGIISALNRPVQNGLGFTAMIQTDAPINPGNSGGALANREGRLIGINTAIQTAGDTSNAGVGFAVPIDTAYNVALRIISGQDLVGGFLGVGGGVSADGASGVEVTSLTDGSGADLAGIRVGDRIVSIDGAPVVNLEQLAGIVSTRYPGDDVEIGLVRNERDMVIVATLGER
jgi:S1-C subfamily serine protease